MADTEARHRIELTVEERNTLEQIATAEPPNSQRAQVILALADGADLAEAGNRAGMTINQARYWSGRFGTRRLSIFPEEILETVAEKNMQAEQPLLKAPEAAPMLEAPELAGILPDTIREDEGTGASAAATAAAVASGGVLAAAAKKNKDKKGKKAKKDKKGKKDKKDKKDKKNIKDLKNKKGKKSKKSKKEKKSKKDKKNKKKK